MSVLLGAIGDDFTGSTDLANTLVKEGMSTVQVIGVPRPGLDIGDAAAVVVALKSRTIPANDAVAQSLAALDWLRGQGARQIFFKYCSTFDSTAEGNIGPVADALMDALDTDFALVCPAFPGTGRTIYQGYLFVGDRLLAESSMKDHPLTPMRDSDLVRLMGAQSAREVGLVPHARVAAGATAIAAAVDGLRGAGKSYGVVDVIADDDLRAIGRAAADHALITGGSGIALGLPANFRDHGALGGPQAPTLPNAEGRSVVLAGSCSAATRGQIALAEKAWPTAKLDVDRIVAGAEVAGETIAWALAQPAETPVLIYSSADPQEVADVQQRHGRDRAGAAIERAMGEIARGLVGGGAHRLIVAGGETAGAVVSALGVEMLRIGPEIDPGVPWTEAPAGADLGAPTLALALKSGNFGAEDFFAKAFAMLD